jgi:drug/metabolite transporter (DMT)-like permease
MPGTSRKLDGNGAAALMIGATGIGLAPIFVRLSETGPVATAFYRILLALPALWLLLLREEKVRGDRKDLRIAALAGFFFASDMALWNWSLHLTTVANSTLLTNFTPFFVTFGARFIFGEPITPRLLIGMTVSFAGGFLLVGESLKTNMRSLTGDILAIVAAIFYAGYILTVKRLRRTRSAMHVMAVSGIFSTTILFLVSALHHEKLLPATTNGWLVVILLALVSHVAGQGLIAYGLAHISAGVSSVMLMWQPVVAAVLAWIMLGEALTLARACGGCVIIVGILIATRVGVSKNN